MSAPTLPRPAELAPGRRVALAWTLGGVVLGSARPPTGDRGRHRRTVCGAARVLTALGVRVEVRAPATAWPRSDPGSLVVVTGPDGESSWLGDLAVRTAVRGTPVVLGERASRRAPRVVQQLLHERPVTPAAAARLLAAGTSLLVRGPLDPALAQAAADAGAAVCPVAVRFRADDDGRPVVTVSQLPARR
jgi:hypothetical protein